jgi:hypothetical protein
MVCIAYDLPGSSYMGSPAEERRGVPIRRIGDLSAIAFVVSVSLASLANAMPYNITQSVDFNVIGEPSGAYATQSAERHDIAYWNAAKANSPPAPAAIALDIFGSSADVANASSSVNLPRGDVTLSSSGVVNVVLAKSGLNAIDLTNVGGITVTGLNITAPTGITPTGLIVNMGSSHLNFSSGSLDLGLLATDQILLKSESEPTIRLNTLTFDLTQLAELAQVDFSKGGIDSALISHNDPSPGSPRDIAFNDPLPITVKTGDTGEPRRVGTPEPGTIILLGVGLIAIGILRMRQVIIGRFGTVPG